MGFPQSQSEAAIQAYGTVQAALEALLAGKGEGMNEYKKKEQSDRLRHSLSILKKDTKTFHVRHSHFVSIFPILSNPRSFVVY